MRWYFPDYSRMVTLPNITRNVRGRRLINRIIGTDRWLWADCEIQYDRADRATPSLHGLTGASHGHEAQPG